MNQLVEPIKAAILTAGVAALQSRVQYVFGGQAIYLSDGKATEYIVNCFMNIRSRS